MCLRMFRRAVWKVLVGVREVGIGYLTGRARIYLWDDGQQRRSR